VVGHIAVQQVAHLEVIEEHWKAQKHESGWLLFFFDLIKTQNSLLTVTFFFKDKKEGKVASKGKKEEELEQCAGGTAEDEIAEAIQNVRENEILYGKDSILSRFTPLVLFACSSLHLFDVFSLLIKIPHEPFLYKKNLWIGI